MTKTELTTSLLKLQDSLAEILYTLDLYLMRLGNAEYYADEPLHRELGDLLHRAARLYDNIQEIKRKLT